MSESENRFSVFHDSDIMHPISIKDTSIIWYSQPAKSATYPSRQLSVSCGRCVALLKGCSEQGQWKACHKVWSHSVLAIRTARLSVTGQTIF